MLVPNRSEFETLSIRTFGWATISLEHAPAVDTSTLDAECLPIQFETCTVEALLIYLACQGRPLGRDVLAELLWPERTQQQARANLRVAIHRLRQQLDPYLLITRQSVALNPDARTDLDAAHFETYLAGGQLEPATALYRGDFLDGFYLDGRPAFEQWALLERERLRTLALAAWQQLIEQRVADGQLNRAVSAAQHLLQLDPLHEPTHRQLMRLLARLGQRRAALAQYEVCRGLLATELSVTPDETTFALYEQIRAHHVQSEHSDRSRPAFELSAPQTSEDAQESMLQAPKSHNLPPQPTPFVGRSASLEQTERLLSNPDCRLLTLLGVGGIGKTRLALETAAHQAANFVGGVYFVGLAAVDETELVTVAIAQSLGIQDSGSDLPAQLAAYLHPCELLLVLDNFDHLLDAGESVAHLLHHAPRLKVLVTSRQRLAILEEWLLPVGGLSIQDGWQDEAGQLFIRSAQRVQPAFDTQGQEEAIAAICRQVEGMPLALELAASWVRVMPCAAIAQQIATNLDFLATGVRNLPERHRSMRALFEQSWRLLSAEEQALLRRMSVFRGGWTLEEAIPVAEATLPLLLSLVDKSLVRTHDQNRFDVHELVRQYAAEQLDASGEGELIPRRHFTAYLQLVRNADRQLRGASATSWYARIDPELDNIRAAWEWALATEHFSDAAWLGVALCHFWNVRTDRHEATLWLEQLLPHRHTLADDLRLATLLGLYHVWRVREDFESIDRYLGELLQLQETSANKCLHAIVWRCVAVASADYAQAVAGWERSIGILYEASSEPAVGDEYCVLADSVYQHAFSLFRYAIRLIDAGEYGQAERLSAESLALFRRRDNRDFIVYPLGNLGRLALLRGDIAQARLLLREAVTIAADIGNMLALGDWLPRLGIVTLYAGDTFKARRLLNEGLQICINVNNTTYLARIYTFLAEMALWHGDHDEAAHRLAQALTHYADPRWVRPEFVDCLSVAARLATTQQQYARAATLFGLAEQIGSHIHYAPAGPVRPLIDAALATVREELSPDVYAQSFAAGQQLSLSKAFVTILAPDQGMQPWIGPE